MSLSKTRWARWLSFGLKERCATLACATWGVDRLGEARAIVPIASVQNRYNLADRASESVCNTFVSPTLAAVTYFPLRQGLTAARQ